MSFLIEILVLLLTAKLLGELAERINIPSIVGYVFAGILLGPVALNFIPPNATEITMFGELGAILLLFIAGLREIRLEDIMQNKMSTIGSAILGYIIPLTVIIFITTQATKIGINFTLEQALLLAVCVSVSSIIVTVKTLIQLGKLNTRVGKTLLSVGILDSVIGMIMFALLLSFITTKVLDIPRFIGISSLTGAFLLIFLLANKILPDIITNIKLLKVEEAQFTMAFVVMLGLAYLAQLFGMHGIIGAFLAGIIISKTSVKESVFIDKFSSLSYGIFVPIFFAWVGLNFTPVFHEFIVLSAIAIIAANYLGAFIGCKLGNLTDQESNAISVGMIPRGGIDLVILMVGKTMGLLNGFVGELIFSTVLTLIILSIIITPPILKRVYK